MLHGLSSLSIAPRAPVALSSIAPRAPAPTLSLLPDALATDPYAVFALLAVAAATGQAATVTRLGKALSAPICAMALTFGAASLHILPAATSTVSAAQGTAVRLATPLLLFDANLRSIGRRASRMLPAFVVGTVGTSAGALVACAIFGRSLTALYGADGYKVLAALAAKNIGGGLNFVAVAAALGLAPIPFATALAMDNIMALVYFPLCAWLGRADADPRYAAPDAEDADDAPSSGGEDADATAKRLAQEQASALALALCAVAGSQALAARFAPGFDLPLATVLVVAAATALPRFVGRFATSGTQLGTTAIFLFFASAGWIGGTLEASSLLAGGPLLLAFLGVLYAVHLVLLLGAGKVLSAAMPERLRDLWSRPQLLVASNANIGGPATASALAVGNGWPSLVTPSLLVGNLGYALATPLGIVLHAVFKALGARLGFPA